MPIQLAPTQLATLRDWFRPERPGPLVGLHVIHTGHGAGLADRWPNPRALLVDSAGNSSLAGAPDALTPDDLKPRIAGFVEAPAAFVPLLQRTFADVRVWSRVIFDLETKPRFALPQDWRIRRLDPDDVQRLWGLSSESSWIWKTWDSPAALAASGYAWGAFAAERLVSVACTFFVGERYEDIGVVTELAFGGRGLSVACAGALCEDILARGRTPSWSTSMDNTPSIRVAEKLGFTLQRHDVLYVIGVPIPGVARQM